MAKVGVKTYNCREVIMTFGTHIISGFAEDSFITIDPAGEGTTAVCGCDGEHSRSMDPNRSANIKISLNQTSDSNKYLNKILKLDSETGLGILPLMITDLRGGLLAHAEQAYIKKRPSTVYGKATQNREWEFGTGDCEIIEE